MEAQDNIPSVEKCTKTKPSARRYYDDLFDFVNSFGPYQKILFFGTSVCFNIAIGAQSGLLILAMGTPRFNCAATNSSCPPNQCCHNCTTYVFEEGQFTSTVTEWNLICSRSYLSAVIRSCFFSGMLIGSLAGGLFSDAYGRRKCMILACAMMVITSIGSSFADSVPLFSVLQIVVATFSASISLSQYTFSIEILGPGRRTMGGQINHAFLGPGYAVAALIGYFVRDWRLLIILCSLLPTPFLLFCKVFPESPSWLITHNRLEEAENVLSKFGLKKTARSQGTFSLSGFIKSIRRDQTEQKTTQESKLTLLDLFRTAKLRKRSLIVAYVWFVTVLVYFGIFLYITNLSGNLYLNIVIMNIVHIPQYFICWFFMKRFGRRIPHVVYLLLTAVCFLVIPILPAGYPVLTTVFAILGKSFINVVFSNIHLFTSELFPTVIRNTALGMGSMVARIGTIMIPYIVTMLPGSLPLIIFGTNALLAAGLSLLLPETLKAKLPQTVQDIEETDDLGILCCYRNLKNTSAAPCHEGKDSETNVTERNDDGGGSQGVDATNLSGYHGDLAGGHGDLAGGHGNSASCHGHLSYNKEEINGICPNSKGNGKMKEQDIDLGCNINLGYIHYQD